MFEDDEGRFDRSLLDTGGAALVVSQFTLLADTAKGNRPSFTAAAPPEHAEPVYESFCAALRELGVPVETGVFGARMEVELVNDGPVTIVARSELGRGAAGDRPNGLRLLHFSHHFHLLDEMGARRPFLLKEATVSKDT